MQIILRECPAQQIGYHQTPNIRRIYVANIVVDHSDVAGASPVGAAPSTSSFSTEHMASMVNMAMLEPMREFINTYCNKHLFFAVQMRLSSQKEIII